MPDPWQTVEERYRVGDIVEGVVTNVVKFGAFVGLEEGLEGLIHVSEFGEAEGCMSARWCRRATWCTRASFILTARNAGWVSA